MDELKKGEQAKRPMPPEKVNSPLVRPPDFAHA